MVFRPEAIPAELRATPQWVLWRETVRDGKPDKPPFDHRTGRPGSVKDPAVWCAFETALGLVGQYSGLGFAFSPRDEFAGIDLDRCIGADGEIAPWAERIVWGMQSYTERSPSGTGLHILLRGKIPPEADRNRMGGFGEDGLGVIEIYDHARYFTVTGDHLEGAPLRIEDRGEEFAALYREIFPPAGPSDAAAAPGSALEDDELLARARRSFSGRKFRSLFDEGDTLPFGGDDSRADLALCSHLAFWSGGAVEVIDRLFRRSALMRDKWDERRGEETYGEKTIARALSGMRAFYDPSYRRPGEDDVEEAGPFHRTDLGNAKRLVARHGDSIRYCHPWGRWIVWAGDRWVPDDTSLVHRHALEVVTQLHAEAEAAEDEAIRKVVKLWALQSESERKLAAIVSLARHQADVPILPAEFDAWPWLLNCPNGTLDLRRGTLGPHVRRDHHTKRTAVPFDAEAACPQWEAFLDRIMGGDEEMAGFLRRVAGYALTGDVSEHALFFLYGRGRNGKSTFLNTTQYALGDYGITINADLLTAKNQDEHPTGLADLQGRRFVATIEVEDGRRLAESLVKTLTGGDRIRARRMRQDFFEFDPTHKIFLAANHKPTVRGTDEGIWRRIKLIPFQVEIPEAEVDRTLPLKLRAEAPGILAWAVRGCLEWQQQGLGEPRLVTQATAAYREEMDVFADFLAERCVVHEALRVKTGHLYQAYVSWCKDTGNLQLSSNKFGRLLTDRGIGSEKVNSVAWRIGIRLKEADGEEGEDEAA